jgi:phenylpropionate dioxygenase-like ring-hydroxylating dioxygenase large terminal subunit
LIPKIYGYKAHWDTFNIKRVGCNRYVIKKNDKFYLLHDRCHHRGYHMFSNLRDSDNINLNYYLCPVHGQKGLIDKLIIEELTLDYTGLVTNGWMTNPEEKWVKLINARDDYKYHSSVVYKNTGDWRFQTELNADMYHVKYIHPTLHSTVNIHNVNYQDGKDNLVQYWCDNGWWGIIYPFYQFENQPGCVYLAEIIPNGYSSYRVEGHFYFSDLNDQKIISDFKDIMLKTYEEDLDHVKNMGEFYGPVVSENPLEDQVVHWHDWYWPRQEEIDKIIKGH